MDKWNVNLRNDEEHGEWHEVTDGDRAFISTEQGDAAWLCEILNILDILTARPGQE